MHTLYPSPKESQKILGEKKYTKFYFTLFEGVCQAESRHPNIKILTSLKILKFKTLNSQNTSGNFPPERAARL